MNLKKETLRMVREISGEKHLSHIFYFTKVQYEHDREEHPGAKDDAKAEIIEKLVDILEILPSSELMRLYSYISELYSLE
ncbi:MAG: hypothetical protein LUD14_10580 [Clostridiales bacterium]|nr:hypothetical protein [Clostridiales bacterium]